jgi:DNA polymerase-3 subunit epsilon
MEVGDEQPQHHTDVAVDLSSYKLTVLLANDHELLAHEDLMKQLDKASGGQTVWRNLQPSPVH